MSDFSNHKPRGCSPRGMVRDTQQARGRITNECRGAKLVDAHGIEHQTYIGVRLVTVKTGSTKYRRMFHRFCQEHGIKARIPETAIPTVDRWYDSAGNWVKDEAQSVRDCSEYRTVFEVTGGLALDELVNLPCIVLGSETATLNVGAPRMGNAPFVARGMSAEAHLAELRKR